MYKLKIIQSMITFGYLDDLEFLNLTTYPFSITFKIKKKNDSFIKENNILYISCLYEILSDKAYHRVT